MSGRRRRSSLVELMTTNSFKSMFYATTTTAKGPYFEITLIQGHNLPIRDYTGRLQDKKKKKVF